MPIRYLLHEERESRGKHGHKEEADCKDRSRAFKDRYSIAVIVLSRPAHDDARPAGGVVSHREGEEKNKEREKIIIPPRSPSPYGRDGDRCGTRRILTW